jgi:DNA repair exonuclease SbcCD ATPase subunit
MKKVQFNSVKIQNFLSVGKDPLELNFQKGINLITGENKDKGGKNGIGKSSILESIYWCLFGNTIRDIKKDKIIHNQSKKDCKVSLNIDITTSKGTSNYTIERYLEPSKVEVITHVDQNDVDLTLSTMPETNEFIKELIGATEEVFQNAVIMSANNTLPFMAQKKTDKRKFIEGILNLNIFSDMLLKARGDYNDFKKKNDILSNAFVSLQRNLSTFQDQKTNAETKKQEKIDAFNDSIKNNQKAIEDLRNKDLPSLSDVIKNIKELEDRTIILKNGVKSFNKTKTELVIKSSNISAEIRQLEKEKQNIINKGNTCPTCNREYCQDDIKAVQEKIKEIDSQISILAQELFTVNSEKINWDDKIDEVEEGIEKINKKIRELEQIKSDIKLNDQKILNCEGNIKDCEKWIEETIKGDSSINTNIENTEKEIENTEKELTEVKKEMSILESVKFIVSEEGVKTYIVKKMLTLLNNKLNFYLQALDTPCKCEFNELFEETIINEAGKECSYFNFSGGERKRIDTAILFMFQDLLRNQTGTSYSLNIYDEMIDSALDQKGTDKILELLKEKVTKYDESVYIVSHKSTDMANIDNTIFLEKENGVTKITS